MGGTSVISDRAEQRSDTFPALGTTTRCCRDTHTHTRYNSHIAVLKFDILNCPDVRKQLEHKTITDSKIFRSAAYLPSDRESYLCRFGVGVQRDEEDLHDALFADRKWDAQVAEGVEGHRDLEALRTDERGLEEAVKRVDDHRVVPPPVVTPRLLCHFLWNRKEKRE